MSQPTHCQNDWAKKNRGQYFTFYQIHNYFSGCFVLLSNPQFDEKGELEGGTFEFANEDERVVKAVLATLPAGSYHIGNYLVGRVKEMFFLSFTSLIV